MLRQLFDILLASVDGLQGSEALRTLAARVTLTSYEADLYDFGGRRFEKIVRFATVDCVKAGWPLKDKGIWSVTEEGRRVYRQLSDPEAFYRKACKLYVEWMAAQPDADVVVATGIPETVNAETETAVKSVNVTFDEAEEQAWAEISGVPAVNEPVRLPGFQELVGDLLRAMPYHVTWVPPPGKDGGIDVLAWPDALGTKPPRIKVQVKRQQTAVSVDGLRSFMALLGDDDVGLFVCTGGFTKSSRTPSQKRASRRSAALR